MSTTVAGKSRRPARSVWAPLPLDPVEAKAAAAALSVDPFFGKVLLRLRALGHTDATLLGGLDALEDAHVFDGSPGWELGKAAAVVREAAAAGGRVYLHGDSDTDGITATLVVERALAHYFPAERRLVHMPDPLDHYGFGMNAAKRAVEFGATVIVTLDCGTNNTEEVAYAAAHGATVIVLDHHELDPGRPYPQALVVNGKLLHRSENLTRLSSGGLAWRFSAAVHAAMGTVLDETDHGASLAYVALSTVVDVVPLVGDNRILVREGLRYLNDIAYATPVLIALRKMIRLEYGRTTLQAFDLGFRIGPLLNLGKRLPNVTPQEIYDLLAREHSADKIASELDRFGLAQDERRVRTAAFKAAALAFIEKYPQDAELIRLAVVRNCPRGIVGLVAQQVASEFKLPAIVLTDHPDLPAFTEAWASLPDAVRTSLEAPTSAESKLSFRTGLETTASDAEATAALETRLRADGVDAALIARLTGAVPALRRWYGSGRCPLDLEFLGMVNATGLAVGHGHRQAVGGIVLEKYQLPAFKNALWAAARALDTKDPELFAGRPQILDAVALQEWTLERANELARLVQPSGQGNPPPLFLAGPLTCTGVRENGSGRMCFYTLTDGRYKTDVKKLGEGQARPELIGASVYVLYEVGTFNGTVSLVVRELARAEELNLS